MAQNDQLLIPEAAKRDQKSFELIRVWVAENSQHVSLRAGVWKDPAWGIMLADLARHIASGTPLGACCRVQLQINEPEQAAHFVMPMDGSIRFAALGYWRLVNVRTRTARISDNSV
jgi:hypothetical protein